MQGRKGNSGGSLRTARSRAFISDLKGSGNCRAAGRRFYSHICRRGHPDPTAGPATIAPPQTSIIEGLNVLAEPRAPAGHSGYFVSDLFVDFSI